MCLSGCTALHKATFLDQYEASMCLINAGALVNVTAQNGLTPLHVAVRNSNKRVCNFKNIIPVSSEFKSYK